jgi:hypothetical protein
MTRAARDRTPAHARVFAYWVELPTWRALSPVARTLLVEVLARFRPGNNGAHADSAAGGDEDSRSCSG